MSKPSPLNKTPTPTPEADSLKENDDKPQPDVVKDGNRLDTSGFKTTLGDLLANWKPSP